MRPEFGSAQLSSRYDAAGRLVERGLYVTVDGKKVGQSFVFDYKRRGETANGSAVAGMTGSVTHAGVANALTQLKISVGYDGHGRVAERNTSSFAWPLERFTYDLNPQTGEARTSNKVAGSGQDPTATSTTSYKYSDVGTGQLTTIAWFDAGGTASKNPVQLRYDAAGMRPYGDPKDTYDANKQGAVSAKVDGRAQTFVDDVNPASGKRDWRQAYDQVVIGIQSRLFRTLGDALV